MVSSTVYGFEKDLRQLCATIESYKSHEFEYLVLNSYIGSIYVGPEVSNIEACLRAVDDCDFFFGIILPRYGSGITHLEFKRAIQQDKPRGFISHFSVRYARELLAQYMYSNVKKRVVNPDFTFLNISIVRNLPPGFRTLDISFRHSERCWKFLAPKPIPTRSK